MPIMYVAVYPQVVSFVRLDLFVEFWRLRDSLTAEQA